MASMLMQQRKVALQIIEDALKELDSPKGSLLSAVQKLHRAAIIIEDKDIEIWCAIQLGDVTYTEPLNNFITYYLENKDTEKKEFQKGVNAHIQELKKLELKPDIHFTTEELNIKADKHGGGYSSIGFITERYLDLVRLKKGNDNTYYKHNLDNHINYIKKKTHSTAVKLYKNLKFSGTVTNCFDLLREAVEDKLLDLNPAIAEQLMLAFNSVSSGKSEEWSQALATCRRLLESLADELYPASDQKYNGRSVGQTQYVNRLWAFMDLSIQSSSNKELAKAHVDFLGSWLEKLNKITNKGVHADLERLEATKSIFHTYLLVADILEYVKDTPSLASKPDINTASLDELEALLNISRSIAKEMIKVRVRDGRLDLENIAAIQGIGKKTLATAKEVFGLADS